jgi:hypothetical protein
LYQPDIAQPLRTYALFLKVREFLYAQQRPGVTRYLVPAILALVAAFGFTAHSVQIALQQGHPVGIPRSVTVSMIIALLCVTVGVAYSQNHLRLETRLNSPSFFNRNREEFLRHGVIAVGSGIIGWLVGHFGK